MTAARPISLADVEAAAAQVAPLVHRTPVLRSATLDAHFGRRFHLKAEHLQRTGSFKVRGALHTVLELRRQHGDSLIGVVTFSAGNHAAAVAYAARAAGLEAIVCMPEFALPHKIAAVRAYGGTVRLVPGDLKAESERLAAELGFTIVHPFDAPLTMAGQGTLALELLADAPPLDVVVVPVGGGGLLSGVSTVFAELSPRTRIVAAEPTGAALVRRSLDAAAPARHETPPNTIADGLAAPFLGAQCFAQFHDRIAATVELSDAALADAMAYLARATKHLVEPSAAAAFAAASSLELEPGERSIGVVLSGGNFGPVAVAGMADALARLP